MSKPQIELSVPIVSQWSIRRPPVYRYMSKQYVDAFFQDGSLRLSSFVAFSKHQDEQRLDRTEGSSSFVNNDPITGTGVFAQIQQGDNAYVLCGSVRYTQDLKRAFGSESGFRINDPTAFGCEIARVLPGFLAGREGSCVYLDWKTINRSVDATKSLKIIQSSDDQIKTLDNLKKEIFSMAGDEVFFLKEKKFEHQAEYRLLWAMDKINEFTEVKCPRALQYCTRFEDFWAGG